MGLHADLVRETTCGKIDTIMLLEFVCTRLTRLPGGTAALAPVSFTLVRACTIVLDNASAHVTRVFKGRREELATIQRRTLLTPASQPRAERHQADMALGEVRGPPQARPHDR
ncbi:hypothetical protein ACIRPX_43715 [Streptomyces sp. NPDC101225]|uniref:hypothetical protein n=1 Tax=Streptomyces sp. NPDC101225 TaxID=3366135 RepID=UPI0037F8786B